MSCPVEPICAATGGGAVDPYYGYRPGDRCRARVASASVAKRNGYVNADGARRYGSAFARGSTFSIGPNSVRPSSGPASRGPQN